MRRKILFVVITIIAGFLLQSTIFHRLALASVVPNLMIIITSSFGFMMGRKTGLMTGFFCGLLVDIFFGNVIGIYALMYMFIGFFNGFFQRMFYPEEIKLPLLFISISDFCCNVLTYFIMFFFRGRFEFGSYLGHVILPELVYTLLIAIVLYMILLKIYKALDEAEKRSAKKFV